jgi:hypothetical protein
VSVGIFGQFSLGGDENHGKPSLNTPFNESIFFPDHDEAGFDFALYPSSSNEFFNESFDGSANHDSLFGIDSSDALVSF